MSSCCSDDFLFVFRYYWICVNSFYESKYRKSFDHFYTISKGSCGGVRGCKKISFPKHVFRASGCLTANFERHPKILRHALSKR